MGAAYRVRQFVDALRSERPAAATPAVALTRPEQELFDRLARPYRRHSERVVARLGKAGQRDPDLLRAALLHDVGKGTAFIGLHHRVLYVLLTQWAPRILRGLASDPAAKGWRRPFYVQANHATIGAALLREVGTSKAVLELVANHHNPPAPGDSVSLSALRQADGDE